MYNGYYDGHGLGWHFDRSEFGVNLVLAEPTEGGTFDYHRNTRDDVADPWAFDTVGKIISAARLSAAAAAAPPPPPPPPPPPGGLAAAESAATECLQRTERESNGSAGESRGGLEGLGVETVGGVCAGSLVFFSGRNSLHRVSPVAGDAPRINCILTYEEQPGQKANAYSLQKFFGRTLSLS